VLPIDRSDVSTVEATTGRGKSEDLRRGESNAATPARQDLTAPIAHSGDGAPISVDRYKRAEATDSIASAGHNRFDQQC
jgi:hypothetical protein